MIIWPLFCFMYAWGTLKNKVPQIFWGFQQERGRDLIFSHKGTEHLDLELYLGPLFKVLSFDFKRSAGKSDA